MWTAGPQRKLSSQTLMFIISSLLNKDKIFAFGPLEISFKDSFKPMKFPIYAAETNLMLYHQTL